MTKDEIFDLSQKMFDPVDALYRTVCEAGIEKKDKIKVLETELSLIVNFKCQIEDMRDMLLSVQRQMISAVEEE